ncbi:MAG TPA: TetR/AcrR family transcriptional regulator [Clostridia bacterium]|nr:TetR/AcrR family transcriptional regulator [Clostridia bacterium]
MISETQRAILEAGKQEFLTMGFQDASLRRIAQKAGVTTGAIYGYYAYKAALFQALVEPTATDFKTRFIGMQKTFAALPPDAQIRGMRAYSSEALQSFLDDIYAHYDAFRLLVCNAGRTSSILSPWWKSKRTPPQPLSSCWPGKATGPSPCPAT